MPASTDSDTIVLDCAAGHQWSLPRPTKGKWPKYCPEHRRFFFEQISRRLKPPRRVTLEWNEQGEMMGDDDYTARWTKFWIETVRLVGAAGGSWNAVDPGAVEKYVRACRMAELHRLYAQDKPYSETSRGTVRAHPGFKLSKEEETIAAGLAVELGITRNGSSSDNGSPKEKKRSYVDGWNTVLQQEAEDIGEVKPPTGPDGAAL